MNRNQSSIITHNGKRIFFSDYTQLHGEEFVECIHRHHAHQMEFIQSEGANSEGPGILVLTDVEGAMGCREVISCFKEKTKIAGKYIDKSAVIGLDGIQKLLLKGVNKFSNLNSRVFDSREEALDWLTK
ncbi:MAG: hypothetical protein JXX29_10930 [Deltaproteobacteria bacterium]|nr:hypothetical protein [Deltaproteobacteria bacterium]MBN2672183.1 hypothetical protein [Deltaproteobacteria bacterium]